MSTQEITRLAEKLTSSVYERGYGDGWRAACDAIIKAAAAAAMPAARRRYGDLIEGVCDLVHISPGLRGFEIIAEARRRGLTVLHNGAGVRVSLHRLRMDGTIRQCEGRWWPSHQLFDALAQAGEGAKEKKEAAE